MHLLLRIPQPLQGRIVLAESPARRVAPLASGLAPRFGSAQPQRRRHTSAHGQRRRRGSVSPSVQRSGTLGAPSSCEFPSPFRGDTFDGESVGLCSCCRIPISGMPTTFVTSAAPIPPVHCAQPPATLSGSSRLYQPGLRLLSSFISRIYPVSFDGSRIYEEIWSNVLQTRDRNYGFFGLAFALPQTATLELKDQKVDTPKLLPLLSFPYNRIPAGAHSCGCPIPALFAGVGS